MQIIDIWIWIVSCWCLSVIHTQRICTLLKIRTHLLKTNLTTLLAIQNCVYHRQTCRHIWRGKLQEPVWCRFLSNNQLKLCVEKCQMSLDNNGQCLHWVNPFPICLFFIAPKLYHLPVSSYQTWFFIFILFCLQLLSVLLWERYLFGPSRSRWQI